MATMTYDQCRTDEERVQVLMSEYGFSEAEARVSCAINANAAKHLRDVRVAEAKEPATSQKKRTYSIGRKQKATAS